MTGIAERETEQVACFERQAASYREAITEAIAALSTMPFSNSFSDRVRDRLIRALAEGQIHEGDD